ncbi:MAG: AbrB/MazE/SpoVT family DNA-binding domain-containing protein [Candidatus Protochlamydia sp.]|nr:AbrB/MazE/SpoVT family DNA-binding domain-containing protein [Candidatus Protochlamydia sp.]
MLKKAILSVQKWGNSLALRIPATIARSAHFHIGTQVELSVDKDSVIIKPTGKQKLTLQERLNLFDPVKHGGEVMISKPMGKEKF